MKLPAIVMSVGLALSVTIPLWLTVPIASYLLEVIMAVALTVMVIENRMVLVLAGAVVGLLISFIPNLAGLPMLFYLPLWLEAVLPPIFLGILISRGWSAGKSFFLASLLIALFTYVLYEQTSGLLVQQIEEIGKSAGQTVAATLTTRGYTPEVINEWLDALSNTTVLIERLLSGMLIMGNIVQLFIALLLVEVYYARRNSYFPGFGPFIYWKVPEKLFYLLGVVLLARLLFNEEVRLVADNLLFMLSFIYAVGGLSLIEHLLRKLKLPLLVKILFYFGLLLMQLPGLIVACLAGLFDSYFDFRRVRAHSLGSKA